MGAEALLYAGEAHQGRRHTPWRGDVDGQVRRKPISPASMTRRIMKVRCSIVPIVLR